jgi:hypothetical protein
LLKKLTVLMIVIGLFAVAVPALAGNPHFVGTATITRDGNTLTVSGKLAGLGNESTVNVVATVDAACVNPGSKRPQAANKQSFSTGGDFPVKNGKADYSLTITANFSPNCSPPMTVVFTNLVVTAVEYGISQTFRGPF